MIEFFEAYGSTILIGVGVAIMVVLIVISMIKDSKAGGCGGGCSGCPHACQCKGKEPDNDGE